MHIFNVIWDTHSLSHWLSSRAKKFDTSFSYGRPLAFTSPLTRLPPPPPPRGGGRGTACTHPCLRKKGCSIIVCSTHPSSSASFSLKSDWKIDWPQSSSLRKLLKDYYVRPPLTIVAVLKKEKTHTLALGKLKVCKNDTPFLVFWIWWMGLVALNTIAPFNLNGREIFRW